MEPPGDGHARLPLPAAALRSSLLASDFRALFEVTLFNSAVGILFLWGLPCRHMAAMSQLARVRLSAKAEVYPAGPSNRRGVPQATETRAWQGDLLDAHGKALVATAPMSFSAWPAWLTIRSAV